MSTVSVRTRSDRKTKSKSKSEYVYRPPLVEDEDTAASDQTHDCYQAVWGDSLDRIIVMTRMWVQD